MSAPPRYPSTAYAPDCQPWWVLRPDVPKEKRLGDERRIAAWLAFNVRVSATFTMRDLREALGTEDTPNNAEHLNRRLRALRKDGWVIDANKDDRTLPIGAYRLKVLGWHPGLGRRPKNSTVSQAIRRRVLERDGRRCVICGVGAGEPYAGESLSRAVMTIGHRTPNSNPNSTNEIHNLQTECKRCNEPVRQELGAPEVIERVYLDVRRLKKEQLHTLREWLIARRRLRDLLDEVYDRARMLAADEREEMLRRVNEMLGIATSSTES
jgi:hypothetical protein